MSTLTAFDFIGERSEGTPGLWNRVFSQLSDNLAAVHDGPVAPSTGTFSVFDSLDANVHVHAGEGMGIGPVPSAITTGAMTIAVSSAQSDYIHFEDSSNARSDYLLGSRVGGTADGLNLWDLSGDTMIVSFSKQSIRFYQNVVGPVFDTGGALADTYNAATFIGSGSTLSAIQAAINQASTDGVSRVYLPASMYPYSASSISFINTVQMVREGGNWSVYDVLAYGANGLNVTSDSSAFDGALSAASFTQGTVYVPSPVSGYKINTMLQVGGYVSVVGENKHATRLVHSYSSTMMILSGFASLTNIWMDGNGSAFSGRGIIIFAGDGKQTVRTCRLTNFSDYCVDFVNEAAGSQSVWDDVEMHQSSGTREGEEAVRVFGTQTIAANSRTFIGCQTEGKRFMDFGPCNNVQVVGSRIGDSKFSDGSIGIVIAGCRIAGQAGSTWTILGSDIAFVGNHIAPKIVIGPAAGKISFRGNTYDQPIFTDLSAAATNVLEDQKSSVSFPFVLFSDGSAIPDISQGNYFQVNNTSATTITNFANGYNGQRISIRLNTSTGIQHLNANIRMSESASVYVGEVTPNEIITFVRISGIWFEEGRSWAQRIFKTNNVSYPIPEIAFQSEQSLGFLRSGTSRIAMSYGQLQWAPGTALLPGSGFTSETSLGWYRSGASSMALSYGTLRVNGPMWSSGISVGGGTLIPQISSMSSLVGAFVVQPSSSSFTGIAWAAAGIGDIVLCGPFQSTAASSISSGLVPYSFVTVAGQIEFRLSNVSTLVQNQSAQTWVFTRIRPF